jgi:hypothetical protein
MASASENGLSIQQQISQYSVLILGPFSRFMGPFLVKVIAMSV